CILFIFFFFFSSRRRHTRSKRDWSSDVCSSDLISFTDHPFSKTPKHVLVICRYHDHWLLTNHKSRGYEFPGGKVEKGETAEQARSEERRVGKEWKWRWAPVHYKTNIERASSMQV